MTAPPWLRRRLSELTAEVRDAPHGGGNAALSRAAYALGTYVPHLLVRDEVERRLLAVATLEWERPMSRRRAEATVRAGIDAGMRQPWHPRGGARHAHRDRPSPTPAATPASEYPPREQVAAIWSACSPVDRAIRCVTHLGGRSRPGLAATAYRIDPEDLARLLPGTPADPDARLGGYLS